MDKSNELTTQIPQPYLGPLFETGIEPVLATGFNYHPAELALHGVNAHNAIDMDLPRGMAILAPADGYYMATYGEFLTRLGDGTPRTLSRDRALNANPLNHNINPPGGNARWEVFFGSFIVQGWHGRGRYSQYAHIDWASPRIPYYPPSEATDGSGKRTGDLKHSAHIRLPVDEYRKAAKFIKAGEVIAVVGMTGCGWGKRCYDFAEFDSSRRPDFRNSNYTYYTPPHLHFATFGRRAPHTRSAKPIDPFGVYGQIADGYPKAKSDWHKRQPNAKHNPLWLAQVRS